MLLRSSIRSPSWRQGLRSALSGPLRLVYNGRDNYPLRPYAKEDHSEVPPVGAGVPSGTPRENWNSYGYETRCASVVKVSDYAMRRVKALSLPIVLGSTFELDNSLHGARLHEKSEAPYADGDGYVYSRWGSPTNEGAARQLAALEGVGPDSAGGCLLFSSGMAAITGSLSAVLRSGDHIVAPFTVYGGTHEFLVEFAQHWGIEYTLVDSNDPALRLIASVVAKSAFPEDARSGDTK